MSLLSAAVLAAGLSFASVGVTSGTTGPRWFDQGRLTQQARQLLDILDSVPDFGLDPDDYRLQFTLDELQSLRDGGGTPQLRARFDTALSRVATRFALDVRYGRVDPQAAGFDLPIGPRADAASLLAKLRSGADVAATVASLEPRAVPYRRLKQGLQRYRRLAQQPELSALPAFDVRSLRPGDEYTGAPQLRTLLTALGDLPELDTAAHASETQIDESLAAGVARFQERHGLTSDGVIGPRTFAALTVPLQSRVRQLELTLERWRWIAGLGRPDIVVNIPQFKLYALRRGGHQRGLELEMPVIVGRNYAHMRTPIFAAPIRQVVFHPFWDVPSGILQRELLPLIRKNPAYLARHHMEIVRGAGDNAAAQGATPHAIEGLAAGRYRLRQRPSSDNALGAIKFVMPNPYNVYLHATPDEALFQRTQRAFSHGCTRVSAPASLAEYVLQSTAGDWSAAAVQAALAGSTTARIALAEPVQVIIFYSTAAASETMGVMFYEDLYGHDRNLQALLDARGH
jgi:murein L,D-transpeptidase YcbB/YkuD